jgi:eukaryotic-like serine/threonine-protein kinase
MAAAATLGVLVFGKEPRVGAALIVFLAVLAPPLALRSAPLAWTAPAAAPALGLVGLAGAYPALAGTARSAWTRLGLGVTGLWWLLLAEALLGRTLLFGLDRELPPRPGWDGAPGLTAGEVVAPLVSSGAPLQAVLWGAAALVMPWVVRGRSLPADIVAATVWAAGLAGATASLGAAVSGSAPKGLVAGALAAGILAVGWRWVHGTTRERESEYS